VVLRKLARAVAQAVETGMGTVDSGESTGRMKEGTSPFVAGLQRGVLLGFCPDMNLLSSCA
jgi:hypothetical protein